LIHCTLIFFKDFSAILIIGGNLRRNVMDKLLNLSWASDIWENLAKWVDEKVLLQTNFTQLLIIISAFLVSWLLANRFKAWCDKKHAASDDKIFWRGMDRARPLYIFYIWLVFQWAFVIFYESDDLVTTTASLLTAWVVIRTSSFFIKNSIMSQFVALFAWTIAALNIVGLLDPTVEFLENAVTDFGDFKISLLTVVKSIILFIIFLWIALGLSNMIARRIRKNTNVEYSTKLLIVKLFQIILVTVAIVLTLNTAGVDLTALTVFAGALGVTLGFGVQKIASNYLSGMILLMDKSIKKGDIISIGDTIGTLSKISGRYSILSTPGGREFLIPNDEFVEQRIENWTYNKNNLRLKLPIRVAYGTDVEQACSIIVEQANKVTAVIKDERTACYLKSFGEYGIELELHIWVKDVLLGMLSTKHQIFVNILHAFDQNGIIIPYLEKELNVGQDD
jgi:small-conductance mechanosensitive channel